MRVLTYQHLDITGVEAQFEKVHAALSRGDFASADVKRLVGAPYHRAKLNDTHRLLLTFAEYAGETVCLLLEVIPFHRYEKSSFLRGARVKEDLIVVPPAEVKPGESLRYVHPTRAAFHLLDKPLSFDDAQDTLYRTPLPLVLLGAAGSGKTALALEKLRALSGHVLYVTLSPHLARQAEALYGQGAAPDGLRVTFLSLNELLETLQVPDGPEVTLPAFVGWFARQQPRPDFTDAPALFEEIRGVITSAPAGPLSLDAYRALGVRQSLFPPEQRGEVYRLYERACAWMTSAGLHDPNVTAHARLHLAQPSYDALIVDEVQDMTPVQLALLLRTLKDPQAFMLCGDANQVVHPNFFSWAAVRDLFRHGDIGELPLGVLDSNFRNALAITTVANRVLSLKNVRFGSVDRDSTFLVKAASDAPGQVGVTPLDPDALQTLNQAVRRNAQFAVIVLRDEDKDQARAHFDTPLIFSVQEVKGLEYDGVILFNVIGAQRRVYTDIAGDLRPEQLTGDLRYGRARDKTDKALEHRKFYLNGLYVALTRAVNQIVLVEDDPHHPLLTLLGLADAPETQVEARVSTQQEWAAEAQRLAAQGKTEQARDITREVLQHKPVPWTIFTPQEIERWTDRVLYEEDRNSHHVRMVFEFALWLTNPGVLTELADSDIDYAPAQRPAEELPARLKARQNLILNETREHRRRNTKWVHHSCDQYGVETPNRLGMTPLTLAALAGNLPLIQELLERGAQPDARDAFGFTAVMHALNHASLSSEYAQNSLAGVFDLLAPPHLDVQVGGRLHRLHRPDPAYHALLRMLARVQSLKFSADEDLLEDVHDEAELDAAGLDRAGNIEGFTSHLLAVTGLAPDAPADLTVSQSDLAAALTQDIEGHTGSRELWITMPSRTFMPNPDLALRTGDPAVRGGWEPLADALHLNDADLPDAYATEVLPVSIRAFPPLRLPGVPIPRRPRDARIPVIVCYRVHGGHRQVLNSLLEAERGLTYDELLASREGGEVTGSIIRMVHRLQRVRLAVQDDSNTFHALMDDGRAVYLSGGLAPLSDDALRGLLAWQRWHLPEDLAQDTLDELRAAGLNHVVDELLAATPFPEHLRGDAQPGPMLTLEADPPGVRAGPDRREIVQTVTATLESSGATSVDGPAVVVEFGDAFFQFVMSEDPEWLCGEIAGPSTRDEAFVVSDAYQARLAASDWTPEDPDAENMNHTQAWNLTTMTLEQAVEETVTLAFDLYGEDPAGVTIRVVS